MKTLIISLALFSMIFLTVKPAASATSSTITTIESDFDCFVMGPSGSCGSFWACADSYNELMALFDIVDAMCE